jgi:RimJ/RimL family protein N-acetyltransferase
MTGFFQHGAGAVRRHGVRGTARIAFDMLRPSSAEQIWYRLDLLDPDRPRRPLDGAFVLRRAGIEDAALLAQLAPDPAVTAPREDVVRERLAEGATLWIVTADDRTAFACWTFAGSAPVRGAPDGRIALPERTALLEDSLSSPHFRGRGVAPGAWSGIADRLHDEGLAAMVTKVGSDNDASRRAVEKAGFREIARMQVQQRPLSIRARIDHTAEPASQHSWLSAVER